MQIWRLSMEITYGKTANNLSWNIAYLRTNSGQQGNTWDMDVP